MKLVVGLGNPGEKYKRTRHNAGFWVIDELCSRYSVRCDKEKWQSRVAECRIGEEQVLLCKPQTFMNLSGQAVRELVHYFDRVNPAEDLIVIYDDMDFAPGRLKLRQQGSAGGHNGLKSIIGQLGSEKFPRIRLGMGRPRAQTDVISYVLSPVDKDDEPLVLAMVQEAADAAECAILNSFTLAMNRYNEASKQQ